MALLIGTVVRDGRYRIEEFVNEGDTSNLYVVSDLLNPDVRYSLEELTIPEDEDAVTLKESFVQNALQAMEQGVDGSRKIYDVFEESGCAYCLMELLSDTESEVVSDLVELVDTIVDSGSVSIPISPVGFTSYPQTSVESAAESHSQEVQVAGIGQDETLEPMQTIKPYVISDESSDDSSEETAEDAVEQTDEVVKEVLEPEVETVEDAVEPETEAETEAGPELGADVEPEAVEVVTDPADDEVAENAEVAEAAEVSEDAEEGAVVLESEENAEEQTDEVVEEVVEQEVETVEDAVASESEGESEVESEAEQEPEAATDEDVNREVEVETEQDIIVVSDDSSEETVEDAVEPETEAETEAGSELGSDVEPEAVEVVTDPADDEVAEYAEYAEDAENAEDAEVAEAAEVSEDAEEGATEPESEENAVEQTDEVVAEVVEQEVETVEDAVEQESEDNSEQEMETEQDPVPVPEPIVVGPVPNPYANPTNVDSQTSTDSESSEQKKTEKRHKEKRGYGCLIIIIILLMMLAIGLMAFMYWGPMSGRIIYVQTGENTSQVSPGDTSKQVNAGSDSVEYKKLTDTINTTSSNTTINQTTIIDNSINNNQTNNNQTNNNQTNNNQTNNNQTNNNQTNNTTINQTTIIDNSINNNQTNNNQTNNNNSVNVTVSSPNVIVGGTSDKSEGKVSTSNPSPKPSQGGTSNSIGTSTPEPASKTVTEPASKTVTEPAPKTVTTPASKDDGNTAKIITKSSPKEYVLIVKGVKYPMVYVQLSGSGYYIGKYEVTQDLWQVVMDNNPSGFISSRRPVENVSYVDCQEFLRRLNTLLAQQYRLPTEEEWEYAAKGGSLSPDYTYSGGDEIDMVAWYSMNSNKMTQNVGQKSPNALGIYDMSGNVSEWCESIKQHENQSQRIRGGSWNSLPSSCMLHVYNFYEQRYKSREIGFRIVLSHL